MNDILIVLSYNLRSSKLEDGRDAWQHRRDSVVNVLRAHQPDLIGVQEAQREQLTDLREQLSTYTYVGTGRLDGDAEGEHCAIGFRNDRFELLGTSTFWLSETPNEPGSIGWDASHSRNVTSAQLRDRVTGEELWMCNTHFDHQAPPEKCGETARRESARILRSRIDELDPSVPAVVTGDFNCRESERPYQIMTDDAEAIRPIRDARYTSQLGHHGPPSTFNDFDKPEPNLKIDYIFITVEWDVLSHGIYEHTYDDDRYPSDHFPVVATMQLSP